MLLGERAMQHVGETSQVLGWLTQLEPMIELSRRIDDATRRTADGYHRATDTTARMRDESRRTDDSCH